MEGTEYRAAKLEKVTVSCEMELEGTGDVVRITLETEVQGAIGGLMDLVELDMQLQGEILI